MSPSGETVVVIGGGIIGTMCGWYLQQAGQSVTLVDSGAFGAGCSHGNCGYVSPSHVLPLTRPGAVSTTFKAMMGRNSPLSIKPRLSPSLWKWLWNFSRHCNQADMLEAASGRHLLLQSSKQLYQQLITEQEIDCEWEERGILFVFDSAEEFEEYSHTHDLLKETFGVTATPYTGQSLLELEPALKEGLGGAWHYECDCHLRPDKLLSEMRKRLETNGVEIIEHFPVTDFRTENGRARAVSDGKRWLEADRFVVATGSMTPFLNTHLGCKIPIQPGKGYSLTMPQPTHGPSYPMIFEEHRVAITPMQSKYRIGSTMEFAGYDTSINRKRLQLLRTSAAHYLHDPDCEPIEEEWFGWRPMTWDGKPIIDRSPAMNNVWVAAGHNMLGLSMATGTGKLVREMMLGEPTHVDPGHYSISRLQSK